MYKLLLLTPDGEDFVTEGDNLTLEEARELSCNLGSKWIFYPLHFIIKDYFRVEDAQRIIEAGELLDWAVNKLMSVKGGKMNYVPEDVLINKN